MFSPKLTEKLVEIFQEKQILITYYNKLINIIKNKVDKEQIRELCAEEQKHISIIKNIILRIIKDENLLQVKPIPRKEVSTSKLPERIIYSEIKIIKISKEIIVTIQEARIKNGLYYIITDDQRHIDTMIFLYSKYM